MTLINLVTKNIYLIEFKDEGEILHVLYLSPWNYRLDLVVIKSVHAAVDLKPDFISYVDIWLQLYNIPPKTVSTSGLLLIAR
jgi:Domain of unknown function (DUF4283)